MSTLERHCQQLLRVYPAAYREGRGDEIIGTLLEATSPGRSWPRARDIRGLILGGLRARAAFNRQLTTAANLRVAVLAGVAAYLAYIGAAFVGVDIFEGVAANAHTFPAPFGWPVLLASALMLLAVVAALLTSRRALVLAAGIPAAAILWYVGPWGRGVGWIAFHLAMLAALAALGGSKRPSRRWLVLISVLAILPVVPDIVPLSAPVPFGAPVLALGAVIIGWAVIDARPAIAAIVFFLAYFLPIELAVPYFALPYLGALTVMGVAAIWLLRRQSAHPGQESTG